MFEYYDLSYVDDMFVRWYCKWLVVEQNDDGLVNDLLTKCIVKTETH